MGNTSINIERTDQKGVPSQVVTAP